MATVKGPFTLEWNDDTLVGVESIDTTYDVASTDRESVQGVTYTIYGAHKATVEIPLLESDVPSLAVVLPQYYVANGGTLSTGETVVSTDGAIDVVPGGCEVGQEASSLLITSCGNPGQVFRLVNATSEISGVSHDDGLRVVSVIFTGTPEPGQATIQFFKEGTVAGVS